MGPVSSRRSRRHSATITALSLTTFGLATGLAATAEAAELDTPQTLAAALAVDPSVVTGASIDAAPSTGTTAATSTTPLLGFPVHGDSYTVLSSGEVANVFVEGSAAENLGGGNVRGDTDWDVTIFKVDVDVPDSANCLSSLTFRFLSQEYPVYVGTSFNDAFIFEVDESTWTTAGSEINVANNLAFDELGNLISINAAGAATMSEELATGAGLNGSTHTLTASAPISPGAHSLYFSIFDQGDHILDSAVLLDNLQFSHVDDPGQSCQPGVTPVYGDPVIATPATFTDGAAPKVQIPNTPGLVYLMDGEQTDPGEYDLDPGAIVTVTARANDGNNYLDGPSSWTHLVPGGVDPAPEEVSATAPTFTEPETGAASIEIPSKAGVRYTINDQEVAAGSHPASGAVVVRALPEAGYVVEGVTGWSKTFTTAPVVQVAAPAPTFDDQAGSDNDTYTIPTQLGVRYLIGGDVVPAGTYPADPSSPEVVVEAVATAGYTLTGETTWSHVFSALQFLKAKKPTIVGDLVVGKTLTAKPGKWKPKGIKFSYKWFRGNKAIKKATGKKYELKKADKGKKLKVKVTGAKDGYLSVTKTSERTGKVQPD